MQPTGKRRRAGQAVLAAIVGSLVPALGAVGQEAGRLLAAYDDIQTVQCDIRRGWDGPEGRVRMNSRVAWERPRRLHVENFSPLRRRYVCDGTNFFYYIAGDPKGFSRPVPELDAEWRARLEAVPGAPGEYLARLAGHAEEALPGDAEFPHRWRYTLPDGEGLLLLDEQRRLAGIDLFQGPDRQPLLRLRFSAHREVQPGLWLPLRHEATTWLDGQERAESTRIENLVVNEPVPPALFRPADYFKDIQFVPTFEQIYGP
ncbi:MAG: hypothetical protein K9N49_00745 [Candidatus Marinimicrobia bacterium]|nr:hypothetical protein [Candidatus Neomarinimicrobiota bacterium]